MMTVLKRLFGALGAGVLLTVLGVAVAMIATASAAAAFGVRRLIER